MPLVCQAQTSGVGCPLWRYPYAVDNTTPCGVRPRSVVKPGLARASSGFTFSPSVACAKQLP